MIARIVERAGEAAKLGFHVHPHMLRHATGYALANEGTDTRSIPGLPRPCLDRQHGALHEAGTRALGGCTGEVGGPHSQHPHELHSARPQPGRSGSRAVRFGRPNPRIPSWGSRNARPRTEARFRGGYQEARGHPSAGVVYLRPLPGFAPAAGVTGHAGIPGRRSAKALTPTSMPGRPVRC